MKNYPTELWHTSLHASSRYVVLREDRLTRRRRIPGERPSRPRCRLKILAYGKHKVPEAADAEDRHEVCGSHGPDLHGLV